MLPPKAQDPRALACAVIPTPHLGFRKDSCCNSAMFTGASVCYPRHCKQACQLWATSLRHCVIASLRFGWAVPTTRSIALVISDSARIPKEGTMALYPVPSPQPPLSLLLWDIPSWPRGHAQGEGMGTSSPLISLRLQHFWAECTHVCVQKCVCQCP